MTSEQRYNQIVRLLAVADVVAWCRYGIDTDDVWRRVCDAYGHVCRRTVYRDLQALESLGFVDCVRSSESKGRKWQWVRESVKGTVMLTMANQRFADANACSQNAATQVGG